MPARRVVPLLLALACSPAPSVAPDSGGGADTGPGAPDGGGGLDADPRPDGAVANTLTVTGRVLDAETQAPLAGVSVRVVPPPGEAITNAQGAYALEVPLRLGQAYRLTFHREGYGLVSVALDDPSLGGARTVDAALREIGATLAVPIDELDLGATARSASFSVLNLGLANVALSYRATVDAPWLSVRPDQGDVTDARATLEVAVDRARLGDAFGEYEGSIVLTSNGGSKTVRVRLLHVNPASQQLVVTASVVEFGQVDVERRLRIENVGATPLHFAVRSAPSFVRTLVSERDIGPMDFVVFPLRADRRPLTAGRHMEPLVLSSDAVVGAAEQTVQVGIDVADVGVAGVDQTELELGDGQHEIDRRIFTLSNQGKGDLRFTIDSPFTNGAPEMCFDAVSQTYRDPGPGVRANPSRGAVAPGESLEVEVTLNRKLVRPGLYVVPLTIDGGGVRSVVYAIARVPSRQRLTLRPNSPLVPNELVFAVGPKVCLSVAAIPWNDGCAEWSNAEFDYEITPGAAWLTNPTPVGSNRGELIYLDERFIMDEPGTEDTVCFDVDLDALGAPGEYVTTVTANTPQATSSAPITIVVPDPVQRTLGELDAQIAGPVPLLNATFDPYRDRLVVHGGVDPAQPQTQVTWEWDGQDLTLFRTASGPPQTLNGLTFDLADGEVVAAGADPTSTEVELWRWEGGAWAPVSALGSMPPRRDVALTYDPFADRVLLYGGEVDTHELNDLWSFDGARVTQLSDALLPVAHSRARLAVRRPGDLLVDSGRWLLPARREGFAFVEWIDWQQTPTNPPRPIRRSHFVLFGGAGHARTLDDTWVWDAEFRTWRPRFVSGPPARRDPAMAFDSARREVVLFGGCRVLTDPCPTADLLADTWAFDGVSWSPRTPASAPGAREGARMSFDPALGRHVLFGGRGAGGVLGDTWLFDGADWVRGPGGPPPRVFHGMAFHETTGVIVLFGGTSGASDLGDTWTFAGGAWTSRPVGGPPARSRHAMGWLPNHEAVAVYSGSNRSQDLWLFGGASWSVETTSRPQYWAPARTGGALAGDWVFGGRVGASLDRQIWDVSSSPGGVWWDRTPNREVDVDEAWAVDLSSRSAAQVYFADWSYTVTPRLVHLPRTGQTLRVGPTTYALGEEGYQSFLIGNPSMATIARTDAVAYDSNRDRLLAVGFVPQSTNLRLTEISLRLLPRSLGSLSARPSTLDLGAAPSGRLVLENAGETGVVARIWASRPEIEVSTRFTDVPEQGRVSLTVTPRVGLAPGLYDGAIEILGGRGQRLTVPVRLEVP